VLLLGVVSCAETQSTYATGEPQRGGDSQLAEERRIVERRGDEQIRRLMIQEATPDPSEEIAARKAPRQAEKPQSAHVHLDDEPCSEARAGREFKLEAQRAGTRNMATPTMIAARFTECFRASVVECVSSAKEGIDEGLRVCRPISEAAVPEGSDKSDVDAIVTLFDGERAWEAALAACASAENPMLTAECYRNNAAAPPASLAVASVEEERRAFLQRMKFGEAYKEARSQACTWLMNTVSSSEESRAFAPTYCTTDAEKAKLRRFQQRFAADDERLRQNKKEANELQRRCGGRFAVDLVLELQWSHMPSNVASCRYEVIGRVLSSNAQFVQIALGETVYLLRTSQTFVDGAFLEIGALHGHARYEGITHVQLKDGSHALPVFVLLSN
jgi:hypothetical protein